MIKVLQIIDGYNFNGIIKLMLEVEKNIDKNIKFDYLTALNICNEFNSLNIDRRSLKGRIIYNHRLRKYLKENKYDIVHINSGAFFFTLSCALICKLSGIKNIIVHSHNVPKISKIKKLFIRILNPIYRKITKVHLTCSNLASKSLYTKLDDVIIIKNGIDIDKYKYNESTRNKYRKELNIIDKKVYGHVGRFSKQKNHNFLIDLFYEIQKKENDAILILIGDGPLKKEIEDKVNSLNISDKVLFLGFRDDIDKLLNTFDIFIFPSLYEGLPITLIEAQTNGVPIVVSNNITSEANISNNYYTVDNYDINSWINTISNIKINNRKDSYKNTIKNGYDIKKISKQLEKIYKDLVK